jgi:hypothetical protein
MSNIGRNDPCPCGSGQKYKRCCLVNGEKTSIANKVLLSVVTIILLGGIVVFLTNLDEFTHSEGGPTRVWSEAHGHWH